jgi:hypothetical protein
MEQSDHKGKAMIDDFDNAAEVRSFRATPAHGFGVAHGPFPGIVGRQQGPPQDRQGPMGALNSCVGGVLAWEAFLREEAIPRLPHAYSVVTSGSIQVCCARRTVRWQPGHRRVSGHGKPFEKQLALVKHARANCDQ